MKKLLVVVSTMILAANLYAEDVLNLKFPVETELKKGYIGKVFVNPKPELRFDGTGKQAKNGKGAIGLNKNASLTMVCHNIQSNKVYRLSVYMKTDKPGTSGTICILWWGASKKPLRTNQISKVLTGDYALLSLTAQAPKGATTVYLLFRSNAPAWADDAAFQTIAEEK